MAEKNKKKKSRSLKDRLQSSKRVRMSEETNLDQNDLDEPFDAALGNPSEDPPSKKQPPEELSSELHLDEEDSSYQSALKDYDKRTGDESQNQPENEENKNEPDEVELDLDNIDDDVYISVLQEYDNKVSEIEKPPPQKQDIDEDTSTIDIGLQGSLDELVIDTPKHQTEKETTPWGVETENSNNIDLNLGPAESSFGEINEETNQNDGIDLNLEPDKSSFGETEDDESIDLNLKPAEPPSQELETTDESQVSFSSSDSSDAVGVDWGNELDSAFDSFEQPVEQKKEKEDDIDDAFGSVFAESAKEDDQSNDYTWKKGEEIQESETTTERRTQLKTQLESFFQKKRDEIQTRTPLEESDPKESRGRELTEEYYLKILLDADLETPSSFVSLFINLQAFQTLAIKNEAESVLAHRNIESKKIKLIIEKMAHIRDLIPHNKREIFIERILGKLAVYAAERGVGYLNLIIVEISLLEKYQIYDYLRLILISQWLRERNKSLTLSKEFGLLRLFSQLLTQLYKNNDPPSEIEDALETVFTSRGSSGIGIAAHVENSPIFRMMSGLADLEIPQIKQHIEWIINQLDPMTLDDKIEFIRDVSTGLISLRNAVWNGFSHGTTISTNQKQWLLNTLMTEFRTVPTPLWQVFASKKMSSTVSHILDLINRRSQWYFKQIISLLTDIKTLRDTALWNVFSMCYDLLTEPNFYQKLIIANFNNHLKEQEIPPIHQDEIIDGFFNEILEEVKPEDYDILQQGILEEQEILFFNMLMKILKLNDLEIPSFAEGILPELIGYLNILYSPLDELSVIIEKITSEETLVPERLEIFLRTGTYTEAKFEKFEYLAELNEKRAFKHQIIDHFTKIGMLFGKAECKTILQNTPENPSFLDRCLSQLPNHKLPASNLELLVSQLESKKVDQRILFIQLGIIIEERMGTNVQDIGISDLGQLREQVLELSLSIDKKYFDKFLEEGFIVLLDNIIETKRPVLVVKRLIRAMKGIKRKELLIRYLEKIAPSIIEYFGSDIDHMYDNLKWAVNIYNKNADETAIFVGLEDKMKTQMQEVGQKLTAIPGVIRQVAQSMGASEDDVRQLMSVLRKISIQFAELEMMMPEQRVGTTRITYMKKDARKTVKDISHRFINEGMGRIVSVLVKYPGAIGLFQEGKDSVSEMLKKIMPVDTISSEDVTIALGSDSKPVLFEERGLVFMEQLVPAIIEATDGNGDIAGELLWKIVQMVQRDIKHQDLGVSFLKQCAEQYANIAIQRILHYSLNQIEILGGQVDHIDELKNLIRLAMPFNEKEDGQPDSEKLEHIIEKAKQDDKDEMNLRRLIHSGVEKLFLGIAFEPQIMEGMAQQVAHIMVSLGTAEQVGNIFQKTQFDDDHLKEWQEIIQDREYFVQWLKRMEEGIISPEIGWMRETKWYQETAKQYIKSMGDRLPSKIKSARDFEKITNKRDIIRFYFEEWEKQKLGLLGNLVYRALMFKDGPIDPLRVLREEIEQIHPYYLNKVFTRHLLLERALSQMQSMQGGQQISYPTSKEEFGGSLKGIIQKNLTEKINQRVAKTHIENGLHYLPENLQPTIEKALYSRIEQLQKNTPPGKHPLNETLFFTTHFMLPYLFAEIAVRSIRNQQVAEPTIEQLQKTSWVYGQKANRYTRSHEYNVIFNTFITNVKELYAKQGILDAEQVQRIEEEMPQQYAQNLDALTVLMNWTMDPEKVQLLGIVDGKPELMQAISVDAELLYLLDKNAANQVVLTKVQQIGDDPDALKAELKKL